MKIDKIYKNPSNPRKRSDSEFKKLVESIKKFPKMMELRPIIYNNEGMILGGNTRYDALIELGYKEIPDNWVKKASELTDKEQLEFIIKDNRKAGEFDFDKLGEFFETDDLTDWGFEDWELSTQHINEKDEWIGMPEFEAKDNPLKIVISFETEDDRLEFEKKYDIEYLVKQDKTWSTWYPYKDKEDLQSVRYED